MIALDMKVQQSDIADLNRAVDLMISSTRIMGKDAVHRAAYWFLRSAKAMTPAATKKMRTLHSSNDAGVESWKIVKGKLALQKASRPSKFYVVQRQGQKAIRILMPNPDLIEGRKQKRDAREVFNNLKAKYKYKPHMKAAKNSWNRAFNKLGKPVANTMSKRNSRVFASSNATKQGGDFNPSIRIINELSYLPKIAPRLESEALQSAGKQLMKIVQMGIDKQLRKF